RGTPLNRGCLHVFRFDTCPTGQRLVPGPAGSPVWPLVELAYGQEVRIIATGVFGCQFDVHEGFPRPGAATSGGRGARGAGPRRPHAPPHEESARGARGGRGEPPPLGPQARELRGPGPRRNAHPRGPPRRPRDPRPERTLPALGRR